MKKTLLFSFVISITLLLTSYKVVINKINANVLSVLGFSKSVADERIFSSVYLGAGFFTKPGNVAQFISMTSNEKTEITKELCVYIKSYVYSQEFKDRYETYRQSKKPQVSTLSEEEKAAALEAIAQQEEMFTPEVLEMLPPESRDAPLLAIADMKAQVNGELTTAQKADWEKKVPLDPYTNIKTGLQTFLDDTKDVDYNATTKLNQYGKKIFTNPVYENKSYEWKACYRSGKEVTDVGRSFAQAWLTEL